MSGKLVPCHKCGRNVKIRQEWHFNQTRLAIHCKCGNHLATDWVYRGEPLPVSRDYFASIWNTTEQLTSWLEEGKWRKTR